MSFYNNIWESPNREESEEDYKHTKCIPIILSYDLQTDTHMKCYLLKPQVKTNFMGDQRFEFNVYVSLTFSGSRIL